MMSNTSLTTVPYVKKLSLSNLEKLCRFSLSRGEGGIVSSDLFIVKKNVCLIVVGNLTKYCDLEQLSDTDAESTVLQMKKIMSRHAVAEVVISDKGPQYASKEFKQFLESWNFHHYTSSPHHPKGNGTTEAAVKQAKRIL